MPRTIANTAFTGRLQEITELQTNLSIILPGLPLSTIEELNFYIPGKSPANIANTAFGERVQNIINLQEVLDNLKVIQFNNEMLPYLDPYNAIFSVNIAMPLSEAQQISKFAFSYNPIPVYLVTSVTSSSLNPDYTTVNSTFDSTLYDLTSYASDIQNSYIIPI